MSQLARLTARRPLTVVLAWVVILMTLRVTAPAWDSVTLDGDFAYLPDDMPSVVGERLLQEAFPRRRAKSQVVVLVSREKGSIRDREFVALAIARRLQVLVSREDLRRLKAAQERLKTAVPDDEADVRREYDELAKAATEGLERGVAIEQELTAVLDQALAVGSPRPPRNREVHELRAQLFEVLGEDGKRADELDRAQSIQESIASLQTVQEALPLLDVWTWRDRLLGRKLGAANRRARLLMVHLSNEFMAVDNMRVVRAVENQLEDVRSIYGEIAPDVSISFSGSAAVGADMLRASRDSIKHTEMVTIILVITILLVVYRSPIPVLVPLITIGVSLGASTRLIALLTQLHLIPGFDWFDFKVFSTTRIFIVVILFGAGTDYCLFLIARFREELAQQADPRTATERSLLRVGDALVASAMTTIVGLAMMFFADFGKYHYSGPVIGLSLAVTLMTSMTLTPALLALLGRWVFWPRRLQSVSSSSRPALAGFWRLTADVIVRRAGLVLVAVVVVLSPFAAVGVKGASRVSYDILASLPSDRPSRRGVERMREFFPVGESGPVTIVARSDEGKFDKRESLRQIGDLSDKLETLPGIRSVRSIEDPLGEISAEQRKSILDPAARRARLLRAYRRIKSVFVTSVPQLAGRVMRLEVVLNSDPFSPQARQTLQAIDTELQALAETSDSFWHETQFAFAGTTAGIRDLKQVTRSDNRRIQMLVGAAVFLVLLVILRKPVICSYMVLTVLFTYFVALGASELFFRFAYGESFTGLDWKVPLFLFVILVAVGQDYNVYLATRVFEEQAGRGHVEGLRAAIVQTGGIITSCGMIMAGTFFSMTSGSWKLAAKEILNLPWEAQGSLTGIVELGFALSLGVALDTFVVRPLLVPAFIALIGPRRNKAGASD